MYAHPRVFVRVARQRRQPNLSIKCGLNKVGKNKVGIFSQERDKVGILGNPDLIRSGFYTKVGIILCPPLLAESRSHEQISQIP